MIHSAAPSLSSSIALAVGMPAVAGDEGAGSGDFAALLGSTLATGQDDITDGAVVPEATIGAQAWQGPGKAGGNTGGKELPLDLAIAASSQPATAAPGAARQIVLPGLVIPAGMQKVDMPKAAAGETSTAASLARNLARAARQVTPAEAQTNTTAELKTPAAPEGEAPPATECASTDAAPVLAPSERLAAIAIPVAIEPAATAPVIASPEHSVPDVPVAETRPAPVPDRRADRAEPKATVPSPAQPVRNLTVAAAAAGSLIQAATKGQKPAAIATQTTPGAADPATAPATAEAPAASGESSAPSETTIRASVGAIRVTIPATNDKSPAIEAAHDISVAIVQAASPAVQAQLSAQQAATTKEPGLDTRQPDNAVRPVSDAETRVVASTVNRTGAAESPVKPVRASIPASPPQPIAAPDAPALQPSAPVVTTPATPVATPTGHDFAALVDRLVEAREATMPQAVHAAIRHGEFGQVSLRFDQDTNGLSVSMTSADPEFAGAVQASAASGQSQTASDNASNAPRQDGRSETLAHNQTAGSPSGQSQGSARNDRGGQTQSETRSGGRAAGQEHQAGQPADTRGGIYA